MSVWQFPSVETAPASGGGGGATTAAEVSYNDGAVSPQLGASNAQSAFNAVKGQLSGLQSALPTIDTFLRQASVVVDFGSADSNGSVSADVSAPWVTSTTRLLASVEGFSPDHTPGDDDVLVEGLTATTYAIVPGVGFTVQASAIQGTWGRWTVRVLGMLF